MYQSLSSFRAGLAEVIWSKEDAFVTFDFQCSPESQNGTGELEARGNLASQSKSLVFRLFAKNKFLFFPFSTTTTTTDR